MRYTFALALCFVGAAAHGQQAPLTYPYAGAPDYCYWLSTDECKQAISIVSTSQKPSYCVDGWGTKEAGLSEVQRRVCWHYTRSEVENDPKLNQQEEQLAKRQKQLHDDAVAGIHARWRPQLSTIQAIVVASKCGVVDRLSAHGAETQVEAVMADIALHAGISPADQLLAFRKTADAAIQAGINRADGGECDSLTPEWRGQMRSLVGTLMR
jgi:hypothetical protein